VIILFGEFWQPGQGIKNGLGERYIILCLLLHIAKTYFMPKIYGYLEEKKEKRKKKVMVKKIWISDFGFRIL
jgi:hypothetical protein